MKENNRQAASSPSTRLGNYLAAAVGVSTLAGTSDAAIVNLDVSPISGPNGGLAPNTYSAAFFTALGAPDLTGFFYVVNGFQGLTGLAMLQGSIAGQDPTYSGLGPFNFAAGEVIDENADFPANGFYNLFKAESGGSLTSPDFGPGSFIGFRSANGHYGWLEVTWDSTSGIFEILSGAYEDVPGVGIQAGAVAAVPEPAGALGTLGLLSAGMFLRRRKRAA